MAQPPEDLPRLRALVFNIPKVRYPLLKVLGRVRRSAYWGSLSTLRYSTDQPEPERPGEAWVTVRPILGGICGSDLAMITLGNPPDSYIESLVSSPMVPGHESVGRVVDAGAAVEGFSVGDRVNVEPVLSCQARGIEPVCPMCAAGQPCGCRNLTGGDLPPGMSIGFNAFTSGFWSEAVVAHQPQLFKVPDQLSDEQAVLVDPLACALHAVMRRRPSDDETALVIGAGIIGIGIVAAIRALGSRARILVLGRHEFQKRRCLERGADAVLLPGDLGRGGLYGTFGRLFETPLLRGVFGKPVLYGGPDVVFDAVGSRDTVESALRLVAAGGTVVLPGMAHPRWVDWDPIVHKNLTIVGVYGRRYEPEDPARRHDYEIIHEMIADGRLATDGLLTHTFPLADYRDALRTASAKGRTQCVKAAFRI